MGWVYLGFITKAANKPQKLNQFFLSIFMFVFKVLQRRDYKNLWCQEQA